MHITVLWFGQLREARGHARESLPIEHGATPASVYLGFFGDSALRDLPVAAARNAERVSADTTLSDGDELAFLPPVGGG